MKELKVIDERIVLEKEFRIYGTVENPLFLAKDVAEWIDYSKTSQGYYNVSKMLMTIDEEEKYTITNSNSGGKKIFLTEDGLYEVLMQSRKPIAKQFKKKVKEILKSIRKHGMYATDELLNNPDLLIKMATKLKEERELNRRLQEENEEKNRLIEKQKPKAEFYDEIIDSTTVIGMKEVADILNVKGYGRNNLFKFLRENGILNRKNEPYRKYIEQGLFEIKESKYIVDNEVKIKPTTYVTQKGLDYIRKILNKQNKQ